MWLSSSNSRKREAYLDYMTDRALPAENNLTSSRLLSGRSNLNNAKMSLEHEQLIITSLLAGRSQFNQCPRKFWNRFEFFKPRLRLNRIFQHAWNLGSKLTSESIKILNNKSFLCLQRGTEVHNVHLTFGRVVWNSTILSMKNVVFFTDIFVGKGAQRQIVGFIPDKFSAFSFAWVVKLACVFKSFRTVMSFEP